MPCIRNVLPTPPGICLVPLSRVSAALIALLLVDALVALACLLS